MLRLSLFVSLLCIASAHAADTRPNIVFVLVDDMGYADLGCMGGRDIRTPHIDRLAAEGVKLDNFYANAPVCTPTRCGFITGRWQQRVGLESAMGFQAEQMRRVNGQWVKEPDIHGLGLPANQPSIAKFLKAAGYATGAFGKWHLGYKDEYNPLHHGFDEYFGVLLGHADYYTHHYFDGTNALRDGLEPVKREGYSTDLFNERAAAFVRKHAREPFFLYLAHQGVHWPFQPPKRPLPSVTRENAHDGARADYKAMLEKIDEGMGMILAELEKAGIANNTLVVLSSDNGGERLSDNRPLFHHKATLWEGGIRVPCLMRWPAKLPRNQIIHQPAITMDLTATFLAAASARLPASYRPDGMNLLPVLLGQQAEVERTFFWRINRTNRLQKAVRHGKWKYVNDGNAMDLLFDLDADIGERRNLNYERPEIVQDLQSRLKQWEAEMDASEREVLVRRIRLVSCFLPRTPPAGLSDRSKPDLHPRFSRLHTAFAKNACPRRSPVANRETERYMHSCLASAFAMPREHGIQSSPVAIRDMTPSGRPGTFVMRAHVRSLMA